MDRLGPRRDTELSVDRPCVAVNRVVRQVELAADVALGQAAGEHSQDHELAVAERSVAVAASRSWRSLEGREPLRQEPGIRARVDRRPRFVDRLSRGLGPIHGLEAGPPERISACASVERIAPIVQDPDAALEQRQRLRRAPRAPQRSTERDVDVTAHLLETALAGDSAASSASSVCSSTRPRSPATNER